MNHSETKKLIVTTGASSPNVFGERVLLVNEAGVPISTKSDAELNSQYLAITNAASTYAKIATQRLDVSNATGIVLTTTFQNGRRFTLSDRDFPAPATEYRLCALFYYGGTGVLLANDAVELQLVNDSVTQLLLTTSTYQSALGTAFVHRTSWTALPAAASAYEGYWRIRNATGARGTLERVWFEIR